MNRLFGKGSRRRTTAAKERSMPRRLRQDLDQALALTDDTERRAAVDRVVQGITEGTYGSTFQRRAKSAATRNAADPL
ncbi:hypothetical protein [Streptomyces sp. Y7]|uniref:hypothetical protein n=1 Tax=Streptomyces sp. Y7 TaxID=3342392 RepID=UPI003711C19F